MYNFEMIIGIEIHVVVNSQSKMFSSSKSSHNHPPNTCINEIDLGLPGIMPQPNKVVVEKAIAIAKALNMTLEKNLRFDRKNYFYQDLPKGFQITQQFFPIGREGYVEIELDGMVKKISIERIHLEEDTAKQIKKDGKILLDYNRAGMPLIEIVTKPEIRSGKEAMIFLKKIKNMLEYCNISDAKLEEGSMRADVNISIMPIGSKVFGQRVEVKNINSISNVEKAILFETNRQWKLIVSGNNFNMETRRFDDDINETIFMRDKTTDVDYRYMSESNILPIYLTDKFIKNAEDKYYVDIEVIKTKIFNELKDDQMARHVYENYQIFKHYNKINEKINNPREVYKWLVIEFMSLIGKSNLLVEEISDFFIQEISALINEISSENINQKQGKELIKLLFENKNKKISTLIIENNFKQINDEPFLKNILIKIIENNPKMMDAYMDRPERVEKFFIGMIMKDTNGQANPNISLKVFNNLIKNKK